ncbi:DNA segregation ATPase FtsK/SpoIIIE, S-DNA-T family [Salinibacillus kushneri]|uniref:DNA segregation ATPase FtsK/SpoIIIE, S-DNA-T family n=1 Tax=Salinibacillus kushneri TaxID=237682 RepID=A0A1I0JET0_9BACI|nr:DNA translocase FtsK [Salinibacillus kushneri]SEU07766.1 DNA segregation ATPase FtsK/SpoIIIE, S-DNA-T family [Salinibacillus kushneri]
MLDRLKKWLKEIFSEEDAEIKSTSIKNRFPHQVHQDDIKSPASSSQSVRTKMSFQYPKQDSFHFPVIPDKPERTKRKESESRRNNLNQQESKHEEAFENDNRIQEGEKSPFQPTDVPSPIYGFRKRKLDDSNDQPYMDIPAYKRKSLIDNDKVHELKVEDSVERNSVRNTFKDDDENSFLKKDRSESNTEVHKNIIPFQSKKERESTAPIKEEKQETSIDNEKSQSQQHVQPEQKEDKEEKEDREEKEDGSFEFTSKPKSRRPYNVMMTPSDKRNLQHKKKEDKGTYNQPPLHLLNDVPKKETDDNEWLTAQQKKLETTLNQFKVSAQVTNVKKGPSVTRFEVQPDVGVKVNKFTNLTDDIKLNLAAQDIRMEAPIPGKSAIGIEVPNQQPTMVSMLEILQDKSFQNHPSRLAVGLGQDIEGDTVVTDLKKMPHGLIAGATGSGKSVCINTVLVSLLYKASYEDVKFLLIDPKVVELAPYNDLPHLVAPVITDVKAATASLKWAVSEMEDRYEKFADEGVRDIDRFNEKVKRMNRKSEKMPYIIVVIDELADLMMASPQDVEDSISRIAQKARACGIHLLLATQRPSVDVITGLIKANVPTRIAFSVSSQVDSRTIIDLSGAEKLLGKGDMLFLPNGSGKTKRIQGAFVSDEEVERVTSYVKKQASPQYLFEQEDLIQHNSLEEHEDDLLNEAIELVVEEGRASTSLLQRKMSIGYNRAARMIDRMEEVGLISAQNGSKPREVLMNREQVQETLMNK